MALDPGWNGGGGATEEEENEWPTVGAWNPMFNNPLTGGWVPSTPAGEGGYVSPYGTRTDQFWATIAANQGAWGGGGGGGGAAGSTGGGAAGSGGGGYWGGGGGGGGGGGAAAANAPWAGAIPLGPWAQYNMTSALPWATWETTPWANVPEGRGPEAMQWMNTVLPWYQQQQYWQQFAQEMAWQQEQLARQQQWQAAQNELQRAAQREQANIAAFGRRWAPRSRWM